MTETTTVEPTEPLDASSIIKAIAKGDTVGAGNSFEDIMAQKKQAAMDNLKADFARDMFNEPAEPFTAQDNAALNATEQEPAVEEE
jgi:hypothetical protein